MLAQARTHTHARARAQHDLPEGRGRPPRALGELAASLRRQSAELRALSVLLYADDEADCAMQ